MKGLKFSMIVTICLAVLSLAGACTSATPQPSATSVPSTPTPIPPTATATPIPPTATAAPTPGTPDQILFYGNSSTTHNSGAEQHLKLLAASADAPIAIEVQMIVRSFTPLKGILDLHGTTAIEEGTWDIVVLQGTLFFKVDPIEDFYEAVRIFDQAIKDAGAQTILVMNWEVGSITIDEIVQANNELASELGIKVAPVGLAFQRSLQERPDLDLGGIHPSAAGTYLYTCVLYATLFDQSPVGIDYQPLDIFAGNKSMEIMNKDWQLTDDEVAFIQQVAWETVVDYQAQNE